MADRPIEPNEAFAMGTLTGVLKEAGFQVIVGVDGLDVSRRELDVQGLVPEDKHGPVTIRLTIEEMA